MSFHPTEWRFEHVRDGRTIWESSPEGIFLPNDLSDEGEQSMLDVYFRGATGPVSFYLRLFNDTPVETDGLADLLNEVTGTGYSAIALARNSTDFPTLALDAGDFRVSSTQKTFTASGTWTAATYAVLATTSDNTGLLVAYKALGTTRTLVDTDQLNVTFRLKLS